jgi:hypothetical protein
MTRYTSHDIYQANHLTLNTSTRQITPNGREWTTPLKRSILRSTNLTSQGVIEIQPDKTPLVTVESPQLLQGLPSFPLHQRFQMSYSLLHLKREKPSSLCRVTRHQNLQPDCRHNKQANTLCEKPRLGDMCGYTPAVMKFHRLVLKKLKIRIRNNQLQNRPQSLLSSIEIHPICQAILDVRRKDHQQREIETVEPNLERSENRDDISEPKTKGDLMLNDGNNHSPRLLTGRVFK